MKSPQKLFENSRRYFIIIIYLLKKMKLKNIKFNTEEKARSKLPGSWLFCIKIIFSTI